MRNALSSGKESSSDSGNDTMLPNVATNPIEDELSMTNRVKKLEGFIEMLMNNPKIGALIDQPAEATNVENLRDTGNENSGPLRTGGAPGDDRDQRKLFAIATLKRMK